MCRYTTHPVKMHYVCAKDRRSKKSWGPTICEFCGGDMINMGADFKPPRKNSDTQWKKIALLVQAGVNMKSCGCRGPGFLPKTYAEAKARYGKNPTATPPLPRETQLLLGVSRDDIV